MPWTETARTTRTPESSTTKKAEAQERISRTQESGRAPSVEGEKEEQETEDRISEREELDQAGRP
jgi:hypothetical protein